MSTPALNLGFLTILDEPNGAQGGYLVTNAWGRPAEFRMSTAVQPNRVQQILYGPTLRPYVCAELIGKALLEKASVPADLIVTDSPDAAALRSLVDIPLLVALADGTGADGLVPVERPSCSRALAYPAGFPEDGPRLAELLGSLPALDLAEPFARVREAISEARKMNVAPSRAA